MNSPADSPTEFGSLINEIKTVSHKLEEIKLLLKSHLMGPDRVIEFLSMDKKVRMYLPFADQDRLQSLILRASQFFEFPLLQAVSGMIKPGDTVLDAGANIGNHTIFFSMFCGAGTVYAFEPMVENYKIFEKNISLNNIQNVIAYNSGLGLEQARASLKFYSNVNSGASTLQIDEKGPYAVMSVDSLALEKLNFMKIDVEGSHEAVLNGSQETLARCKPLIWIELRSYGKHDEFAKGDAQLRSLGYKQIRSLTAADFLYAPV